ncbi:MAG: lyase family protein [Terrimesophilobacter sp.]
MPTDGAAFSDDADYGLLDPSYAGTPVAAATGDRAVLTAILDVETALVDAYAHLGLAPRTAPDAVRSAIAGATHDPATLAGRAQGGGNPVIPLVSDLRNAVTAIDADAGLWVHRGATSQDILDTALMLVAHRARVGILRDATTAVSALVALTQRHRETVMVSRTLTQHGVPTTFGMKTAGWLHGLVGSVRALARAELPVQWGGAGGTLASFVVLGGSGTGPAVAGRMADSLGLTTTTVPWQNQRAPITRLGDTLASLADSLGTIAGNVLLLSRPEIAELAEPSAPGRGVSSAMPQKHNPVLSVLIASATRRVPSLAADLHRSATTVDERPPGAWHAEWQTLRELLRLVGGACHLAAELTPGLVVDDAAMRARLEAAGPLVVSERLMLQFGPLIGRTRLQELVSAGGNSLADSLRAEPAMAQVTDAQLNRALDPADYLGDSDHIIDAVLRDAAEGLGQ